MAYPYQIKSVEEYKEAYEKSVTSPEEFWAGVARHFVWKKKWDKVLDWNFSEPKIEWFKGAELNITENCIDRHLPTLGDKPALIWEPNNPTERVRTVTYNRLHKRVCQVAQMLVNNGVTKGDRVIIYMGMVPELAYAVLGCARMGAVHSVVFGGFSAQSIADRVEDAGAEYIITCDGAYRGDKVIPLKSVIDDALVGNTTVKKVIVYTRTRTPVSMIKGRDIWWEDEMEYAETQVEAGYQQGPHLNSPHGGGTAAQPMRPPSSVLPPTGEGSAGAQPLPVNDPANPEIISQGEAQTQAPFSARRRAGDEAASTEANHLTQNAASSNSAISSSPHSDERVKSAPATPSPSLLERGPGGEVMSAEDPLFILYTSGSTGKPKGVVHTCGGYMVWAAYTFVNVFQYQPGQVHFCTADIGWITGHSYILYGPLAAGATSVMFEGLPNWPDAGRLWDIIDRHKVNILYTAPTAIRSLMGAGLAPLEGKDLSSLQVLGTVGEPINEEAWRWYGEHIGKGRCPIVDTWWQTETGGILISNLANVTAAKPAFATLPLPGVQPILVDEKGEEIEGNPAAGNLCIKAPWPGMLRTTWGDHERCRQTYFATYPGLYFTGDGALRDESGNYCITGRVDDVLNVSGHRIGTAEVENAINMYADVVESAVVGYPHAIKGQGIYAYVILSAAREDEEALRKNILQTVTRIIGPIAKPDKIQFVKGLPKTRSGKIMRRILRKIAEGETESLGDVSTLLDPGVVEEIVRGRV